MKLRVICQKCGDYRIIDTEKPSNTQGGWFSYNIIRLIEDLPEYLDYKVCFCGSCMDEIRAILEGTTDKDPEDFFKKLFEVTETDMDPGSVPCTCS